MKPSDGYMLYPGLTKFPAITGHELSGKVVELGKDVKDLKVGDMVTVEEMIWCGHCTPCRNGFPNHCTNLEEIGFTTDGGFANYLAIGAKFAWKINAIAERFGDENMSSRLDRADLRFLQRHVLAGGGLSRSFCYFWRGPIGLAAIGLAEAAGPARCAFEVIPERRVAKKLGRLVYDRARSEYPKC
jgi:threonine dehydrogenase-like Zn-dependent dehydrogenase